MVADAAPLPREPDVLIGMIVALREENSRLQAMLETARRALYGARSEKFDGDAAQLPLGLGDVSTTPVEPAAPNARPPPQNGPARPRASRNIGGLPKHLPARTSSWSLRSRPAHAAAARCTGSAKT